MDRRKQLDAPLCRTAWPVRFAALFALIAAELHGLHVLAGAVQDDPANRTFFAVLRARGSRTGDVRASSELEDLRARIRALDEALIRLLARRFEHVRALGHRKVQENLPIEDEARESAMRAIYARIAEREGVAPALVQRIFAAILAESKSVQRAARGSNPI